MPPYDSQKRTTGMFVSHVAHVIRRHTSRHVTQHSVSSTYHAHNDITYVIVTYYCVVLVQSTFGLVNLAVFGRSLTKSRVFTRLKA